MRRHQQMVYAMGLGNNVLGCVLAVLTRFPVARPRSGRPGPAPGKSRVGQPEIPAGRAGGRREWDSAIARLRREAGLASNNAEQVLQRLRIERRLDRSAGVGTAALRTLPLLRRVAGSTAHQPESPGRAGTRIATVDYRGQRRNRCLAAR